MPSNMRGENTADLRWHQAESLIKISSRTFEVEALRRLGIRLGCCTQATSRQRGYTSRDYGEVELVAATKMSREI